MCKFTAALTLLGGRVSVTPWFALLAKLPHGPIHALLANTFAIWTSRMVVAPAILRAVISEPPQITFTSVIGFPLTSTVNANIIASSNTRSPTVSYITFPTMTTKGSVGVGTDGLGMAVVKS